MVVNIDKDIDQDLGFCGSFRIRHLWLIRIKNLMPRSRTLQTFKIETRIAALRVELSL